ncbi:MAG: antibiotic biosynthesis monooxygenase [Jatrophihabitans sp.]|nr:MAG: antibiotic biosynthesis monooxygenase [Jatrophihabitans sp.]
MSELITAGIWLVKEGEEEAFVRAWTGFATWAATMPGATTLRLGRDRGNPSRFVSFAPWDDGAAAHAWKAQPEFRERMARVQQHVAGFEPIELDALAAPSAAATVA